MTSLSDETLGGAADALRADPAAARVGSWLQEISAARALRAVAVVAALVQLGVLLKLASYVYDRLDLSQDFNIFEQARYLIAHGVLDPYTTSRHFYYWQNHGEFIMWPLAWISRVTVDSGFFLLMLQAAATAGATCVASFWLIESWERHRPDWPKTAVAVVVGCVVILLVNPWIYLSDSYDFHFQALDGLLLLLAARAIDRRTPRSLFLYVPLLLATGDVAATYVVALGVSAAVVGYVRKDSLRVGAIVFLVGIAWTIFLTAIDANKGSNISEFYGYLATASGTTPAGFEPSLLDMVKGAVLHPGRVLSAIHTSLANDWANVAAPGLLGVLSIWALPLVLVTEASYALIGGDSEPWSRPSFQSIALYAMVTAGTGMVVFWGLRHARRWVRVTLTIAGAVALIQALVWSAVMLPHVPEQWHVVSTGGKSALSRARALIPHDAEVVVQEGVVGAFADHRYVYFYNGIGAGKGTESYPVHARTVYFVGAFLQGQEEPPTWSQPVIAQAAELPGAKVLVANPTAGVWLVRWTPPRNVRAVKFHGDTVLPAWLLGSTVGRTRWVPGPASGWYVQDPGLQSGYVTYGDYYQLKAGQYVATARLKSSGPVSVQVWNDVTNKMVASRVVSAKSLETVRVPLKVATAPSPGSFSGGSMFSYRPVPPVRGNSVEVRIYADRGVKADVYSVNVTSAG